MTYTHAKSGLFDDAHIGQKGPLFASLNAIIRLPG